ncbi:hypothetical protein M9458_048789, partial [Cirrhinus mrigala]
TWAEERRMNAETFGLPLRRGRGEGAGAAELDEGRLDLTLVEVASEEHTEEVKEEESSLISNTG